MTSIYLIRHGETLANRIGRFAGRTDEPLTDLGRQQAQKAAAYLAETGISIIYTSPVARARETASIIGTILDVPVKEEPGLSEILIPQWEGRLKKDLEGCPASGYVRWKADPAGFSLPGVETLAELQKRAMACLKDLTERPFGKTMAAVTHLAVIRVVLLAVEGKQLSEYRLVQVRNAAPLAVTLENGNYYVRNHTE